MKKILGLLFMLLVITGCSGGKETTTTCKYKDTINNSEATYVIDAKGDEVTTSKVTQVIDFNDMGAGDTDEEIKEYAESMMDQTFPEMKGATYELESVKDGVVTIVIEVDYSKVDLKELQKLGNLNTEDSKDADYVSLEKTIKSYKDGGMKCNEE